MHQHYITKLSSSRLIARGSTNSFSGHWTSPSRWFATRSQVSPEPLVSRKRFPKTFAEIVPLRTFSRLADESVTPFRTFRKISTQTDLAVFLRSSPISVEPVSPSRNFSKSLQAPAVVCAPKPPYGPQELARTELLNGIRVVGARLSGYHLASCTILFAAGSRYEMTNEMGCSHFIRACSDAHGKGYTSLAKSRVLQQFGAYLTCTSDRQNIVFTLQCAPPDFPALKHLLLDAAVRNNYADFDIDERRVLVKEDLVRITPEQRIMDLIQRACWTGPLHNSPFCPSDCIEGMCSKYLQSFVSKNFLSTGCTVASIGVPYDETVKLAEEIQYSQERPMPRCEVQPLAKRGVEQYDLGKGSDTWVAVAVPGIGTLDNSRNISHLLRHAILAEACGSAAMAQGQDLDQVMQPPLGSLCGDDCFTTLRAFNISYWDVGLFGIVARARACMAQAVAKAAQSFLANVQDLDLCAIDIGKQRLKLQLARQEEHATRASESLALMAANNITLDDVTTLFGLIDCLPAEEVRKTAIEISNKRRLMCMAVVGDIGMVSTESPFY